MFSSIIFVLIFGITLHPVVGQVSPYNMFANCPEGCRDVDKIVSCGSVDQATSCNMAQNGDVLLQCSNGNSYALDRSGCSANVSQTTPFDYFFDKTQICVTLVAEQYSNYKQYFAPVLLVIVAWVTVAGFRFYSYTLTVFAFLWEFFFALYILIMAQATNTIALYLSLAVSAFVALLCLWKGPIFGRAIVGVCSGSLVGILCLVVASEPIGYVSTFVVVGLDIIFVIFAYIYKNASIIGLFTLSVFVMTFTAIASLSSKTASSVRDSASSAVLLICPAGAAALLCLLVNIYWFKQAERRKKVNQRFNAHMRHRGDELLRDVSVTRPGDSRNRSPASRSGSPRANRSDPEYGAVYQNFGS